MEGCDDLRPPIRLCALRALVENMGDYLPVTGGSDLFAEESVVSHIRKRRGGVSSRVERTPRTAQTLHLVDSYVVDFPGLLLGGCLRDLTSDLFIHHSSSGK